MVSQHHRQMQCRWDASTGGYNNFYHCYSHYHVSTSHWARQKGESDHQWTVLNCLDSRPDIDIRDLDRVDTILGGVLPYRDPCLGFIELRLNRVH